MLGGVALVLAVPLGSCIVRHAAAPGWTWLVVPAGGTMAVSVFGIAALVTLCCASVVRRGLNAFHGDNDSDDSDDSIVIAESGRSRAKKHYFAVEQPDESVVVGVSV